MRIGVYIPAYNELVNVSIIAQMLNELVATSEAGHALTFWSGHSCDLISMRNGAVATALKLGLDYLYMQDSDVICDAKGGAIMPLLRSAQEHGATLTGALVSTREMPPKANAYPVKPGEVYEADKLGSGMILIDLNRLREWYPTYEGPCFARQYTDDRAITSEIGSDIYFCYVVRAHGGKVVCNATLPTTHINAVHRLHYDGQAIQVPDTAGKSVAANGSQNLNPLTGDRALNPELR